MYIEYLYTFHLKNGTCLYDRAGPEGFNVETGLASIGNRWFLGCISANLSDGDPIYTGLEYNWRINETVSWKYPDENRPTLHVCLEGSDVTPEGHVTYGNISAYWDKKTGVLVRFSMYECEETAQYRTEESHLHQLIDTNLWIVPEFPSFLILPLFMIATLLAVIVYKRKHTR